MSTITDLSKKLILEEFFLARLPKNFCSSKPMIKGKSTCKNSFCTTEANSNPALLLIKILIHSGVTTIPINPERLALKIAVGTSPLASDTITTEELTVEGKAPRKNRAIHNLDSVPPSKSGEKDSTRIGKIIKVVSCIRRCTL